MTDDISIACDQLPPKTVVEAFHGVEAISQLFQLSVYLLGGPNATAADLDDLVGAEATLKVGPDDADAPVRIHGVFADVELIGRSSQRLLVCATLVPRVWLATQNRHSRVYTDQSIPDIIKAVLDAGGLAEGNDYSLALEGQYGAREFVCQYEESDFDFISRWMEREGLLYYFDQTASDKLVITDSGSVNLPFTDTVRFRPGHHKHGGECLRSFRRKNRILPNKVTLEDYDYMQPDVDVSGVVAVGDGGRELRDFGLGFNNDGDGQRWAMRRFQQTRCRKIVCRAEGTTRKLRSGYRFHLDDHPEPSLDADYLVTRLEHFGLQGSASQEMRALVGFSQDEVYRVEAELIPLTEADFRPAAVTPWPRVSGFQLAVVDGPDERDYAQIDDQGRYKVKLKLDESDLEDGHASAWVRRLQPLAGTPEGFHFPLRKGTEVLLTFLGGDPDQPVIAGAVPNAKTPSPVTESNDSTNRIETGGGNSLEMVDARGGESITLYTPKDKTKIAMGESAKEDNSLELRTDGDGRINVEGLLEIHTGKHKNETIDGNFHETVLGSKGETVIGYEDREVVGLKTETIAGGEVKVVVGPASDTVLGFEDKNVIGGEVKFVVGLLPIASQVNLIGGENKNILGFGATNVLGAEMKFVGGGVQETIVGVENKNILGGVVELVGGAVTSTVLGVENKNILGGEIKLVGGAVTDTVLGIENKNIIGGEVKLLLGLAMELALAIKVEVHLGAKLEQAPEALHLHNDKIASANNWIRNHMVNANIGEIHLYD